MGLSFIDEAAHVALNVGGIYLRVDSNISELCLRLLTSALLHDSMNTKLVVL